MFATTCASKKEGYIMGTVIIIAVAITFLTAIFTGGYNDKPSVK
ncbi:hypothetical protein J2S21_002971 [Peribacillus cavernae]|nr:hypothetical protein [Peribacillus cavernae]